MTNIIKKLFWLLLVLCMPFLQSCRSMRNRIYYNYRNITIERVDYNIETYFYYYKDGVKQPGCVYTKYYGMGGMFNGGIVFKPDGKVLFLEGDGVFELKEKAPYIYIRRWEQVPEDFGKPFEPYEVGQRGVYYLDTGIEIEQQTNKEEHADPEIRAIYFNYDGTLNE